MEHRTRWISRCFALCAATIFVLPAACIYPEYTFNEPETSSSGGGGGSGSEDCANGSDDDGDSLVDCADSDCSPIYECVPSAPLGWTGYVSLFDGDPTMQPECPSVFPSASPYVGHRNLLTPAHSCAECSCGAPTGETCDLPDKIDVLDKPCGSTPETVISVAVPSDWQGECVGAAGYEGGLACAGGPCHTSITAAAPVVTGGSCEVLGGTPDIQPEQWEAMSTACGEAPHGGGCGAGSVCQPKSAAPFMPGLCVFKEGDNSCPIGPFSEKFVYFEKADDTRACSACECGAPEGSTCDATFAIYSDQAGNTCTTELVSFAAGTCLDLANNPTLGCRGATVTPPSGGACPVTAGGGQATGELLPVNPTTFCCMP